MRAYVINLDRRPDRLDQVSGHLAELGLPMVRVPAVDGRLWDGVGWRKHAREEEHRWRGGAGCYFSHIRALQSAIAQNVFPCMILEDDAVLSEVPVPEPGMIYLGGFEIEYREPRKPGGIFGLHAVMYHTAQDASGFLAFLTGHKNTADSVANQYRKKNIDKVRKYSKGWIAHQRTNYSDIECVIMDRPQ
jgi:hypothetical protein